MKKLVALVATLAIMLPVAFLAKSQKPAVDPALPPVALPPFDHDPKLVPVALSRDDARSAITVESCKQAVFKLCSDEWEGRMTGHRGNVQAAAWIESSFKEWGLTTQLQQFPWQKGVNPGPKGEQGDAFSNNVIGVLNGTNGKHIVVGAHFDHLGYGPKGSRYGQGKIHYGADDNATGTTLVLEVAQGMSRMKYRPRHTIIFIAFSGEEMGLIGSEYYCKNPVRPLSECVFMFNTDMIGRMNGKTSMSPGGNAKMNALCQKLNQTHPVKMTMSGGNMGGSDHAPFVKKGVPACCFHSGMHDDYHTPNDSPSRIDYEGMHKVVRYAFDLILEADQN